MNLFVSPGTEQSSHRDELAEVIRVMIGDKKGFTQDRLALAMRDRFEQVYMRIGNQVLHGLQVGPERGKRLVPRIPIGWRIAGGPVTVGEFGRDVPGIDAEAEDVPLGDPHVLDQAPGSVRQSFRPGTSERNRQASDCFLEIQVRMTSAQELQHMLTQ
jgi:hypothetical protein